MISSSLDDSFADARDDPEPSRRVVVGGTVLAEHSSGFTAFTREMEPEEWKGMPPQTLESKVEGLERRVTLLEKLPKRMDALESQIVQLRTEMRDEFSAVRTGLSAVQSDVSGLRGEMTALRQELNAGDEETRRHMRVLIEDVISRIATLDEGRSSVGTKRRRKRPSDDRSR